MNSLDELLEDNLDLHDVDDGEDVETSRECQMLDTHMRKVINSILHSLQNDPNIKEAVKNNLTPTICGQIEEKIWSQKQEVFS